MIKTFKEYHDAFKKARRNYTHYSEKEKKDYDFWFNKIEYWLEKNDKFMVLSVLEDWQDETLPKFDLYTFVIEYFKEMEEYDKYNL